MRHSAIILFMFALLPICSHAQGVTYKTFIYTSDNLSEEIARESNEYRSESSRGYFGNLFDAGAASVRGIASGYVTSVIDLGVNAIGALVTRRSRQKEEWEETVKQENTYQTQISTVSEINDFYSTTSYDGAMDPKGMRFDGIGCLRKEGNDTVFFISCHIDRSKLYRIINHSKFELVLDTLIISPSRSNLPNSKLDLPFSWEERKNFNLSLDITLTSSWMSYVVQLHKDQELGSFSINIPVNQSMLDADGYLRYVRQANATPRYKVVGESFIVPRSYMGYRDENNTYRDSYGTGEYKLSITLKETCDVTDAYREDWKADRKRRNELQKQREKKGNFFATTWKTVSSQQWDELSKSWIITTLQAPAAIITSDVIDRLGLESTSTSSGCTAQSAPKGNNGGNSHPGGNASKPDMANSGGGPANASGGKADKPNMN